MKNGTPLSEVSPFLRPSAPFHLPVESLAAEPRPEDRWSGTVRQDPPAWTARGGQTALPGSAAAAAGQAQTAQQDMLAAQEICLQMALDRRLSQERMRAI